MSRPRLEGRGHPTSRPRPATPPFAAEDIPAAVHLPHAPGSADRSVTAAPGGVANAWGALGQRRTVSQTMKLAFQDDDRKAAAAKAEELKKKEEQVAETMRADGNEWVDYVNGHLRDLYPSVMGVQDQERQKGAEEGRYEGVRMTENVQNHLRYWYPSIMDEDEDKGDDDGEGKTHDKPDKPDFSTYNLTELRGFINGYTKGVPQYYAMSPGMGMMPGALQAQMLMQMSAVGGMPPPAPGASAPMGMGMGMAQMPGGPETQAQAPAPAPSAPLSASLPPSSSAPFVPPTAPRPASAPTDTAASASSAAPGPATEAEYEAYMAQYTAAMQQYMADPQNAAAMQQYMASPQYAAAMQEYMAQNPQYAAAVQRYMADPQYAAMQQYMAQHMSQGQSQYAYGYPYQYQYFDAGAATTGAGEAKDVPGKTPAGPSTSMPFMASMPGMPMAAGMQMGTGGPPLPGQRSASTSALPTPLPGQRTVSMPGMPGMAVPLVQPRYFGVPLPAAPNPGGMPDMSAYKQQYEQQQALGLDVTTLTRALDVVRALDTSVHGPRSDGEVFAEANLVALGLKPRIVESE